jgi:hypothetical protein
LNILLFKTESFGIGLEKPNPNDSVLNIFLEKKRNSKKKWTKKF